MSPGERNGAGHRASPLARPVDRQGEVALDHIWFVCISLRHASTRREAMKAQFERLGLEVEFLDGIVPNEDDYQCADDYDRDYRSRMAGKQLTRGEVGCYRTHMAAWRRLATGQREWACVIEDDVLLSPRFPEVVGALASGPQDWDLVRLAGVFTRRMRRRVRQAAPGVDLVEYLYPPRGTQAYIVRRAAAVRLLEHCAMIRHPIDDAMDRYWEHELRLLAVRPWVAAEDSRLPSTISGRSRVQAPIAIRARREFSRVCDDLLRLRAFSRRFLSSRQRSGRQ